MSDLSLTDASVRAAVDAEAAGDDAFRARLVTGAATKGEMRTRLAARLSTEEVNLKPFKAAMIDAMMRHYTEKDAAAAAPAPPSATSPLDPEAPSPHRRRIIAAAEAPRSALADRTNLGLRGSKALVAGVAAPGAKLVPRRSPIPIKTRRRSGTY